MPAECKGRRAFRDFTYISYPSVESFVAGKRDGHERELFLTAGPLENFSCLERVYRHELLSLPSPSLERRAYMYTVQSASSLQRRKTLRDIPREDERVII